MSTAIYQRPPPLQLNVPQARILLKRMVRRIWNQEHLAGFSDQDVYYVLDKAIEVLAPEPATLSLSHPIVVFGDTHGQLSDLLRFFKLVGTPPSIRVLFLGDYVDRCKKSFEVIMLLLCYKLLYPRHVFLLRGNHECSKMNRIYGFHEELLRKRSAPMWKHFNMVFNELPLSAVISKKILCMHGGISPSINSWKDLVDLQKPRTPLECDEGLALDLMWSDPASDSCCTNFQFNSNRATSVIFGDDAIKKLCDNLGIDFVVRAHEVVKDGHQWAFNQRLLTLFSAPNYCGSDGNSGSVMKVSADLEISFVTLRPVLQKTGLTEEQKRALLKQQQELLAKSPNPTAGGNTAAAAPPPST